MTTLARLGFDISSRPMRNASRELDRMSGASGRAERSSRGLSTATNAVRNAVTGLIAAISVREVIRYADSWQNVANQLRQVTDSSSELADMQARLVNVAKDTRSNFDATANLYARLARSTTEMGLSTKDLIDLTTTINQSFAVSGATAQETSAAITQLSQGLSAGALRGEEFNSVSEQAPALMRAIGDSLDMTIGNLRAFAQEGGITAEIVVNALRKASDEIDNNFNKTVATFGQNLEIARTNLMQWVGSSDAVNNSVGALGSVVVNLSEGVDELATVAGAAMLIWMGRLTGSLAGSASAMLAAQLQAMRYQATLASMAGISRGAAASQIALAGAVRGAGAAMAFLGGPVGVALIAAGSLYYFRDSLFDTNIELTETEKNVRALSERLSDLTTAELQHEKSGIERQLRDTAVALATAREETERLTKAQSESSANSMSGIGSVSILADMASASEQVARLNSEEKALESTLLEVQEKLTKTASAAEESNERGAQSAAEAVQKIIDSLDAELFKLEEGDRAWLARRLSLQDATEDQIKYALSVYDAIDAEEAAIKQADSLADMRQQADPAFAEFNRYADQIDQIEAFNISAAEKEMLREAAFSEHNSRMSDIAAQGSEDIGEASAAWAEKISQNQQQIQVQMAQTLGNTIGLIKGFTQEGTAEWAAMVLAQKGIMAAQAIMAANLAATMALASPLAGAAPAEVIAQAESMRLLGYANAALIMAQGVGEVAGARASGGSVSGGKSYLVGERGPELVTMGGSGHVTPNNKLGGGNMSVEIIDQSTGSKDYQTETVTDKDGTRKMRVLIRDMMREDIQRGEFDRQMESSYGMRRKARRV